MRKKVFFAKLLNLQVNFVVTGFFKERRTFAALLPVAVLPRTGYRASGFFQQNPMPFGAAIARRIPERSGNG
jgi:hypothetical protein